MALPPDHAAGPHLPGDGTYEVILTAMAAIDEAPPGAASAVGPLRVIQGAVSDNPDDGFYAFVSVGEINVPLVASHLSRAVGRNRFEITIPHAAFVISLDDRTEPRVVAGMQDILRWYTTWNGDAAPEGSVDSAPHDHHHSAFDADNHSLDDATMAAAAGFGKSSAAPGPAASSGSLNRARSKIDRAGVKGADMVTSLGERVNSSLKTRVDAKVAHPADSQPRDVKLGGTATATVLDGAKKVAGTGAGIAATVVDKLSSSIGSGFANNKVMTNMRSAPEESKKRQAHDLLVSGAMACGRVIIAADEQGKLLFETAGDGAGRYAGSRYGAEAEHAARSLGNIGLSGYRILRFPKKLVGSSLVKGAVKGASVAHAEGRTADVGSTAGFSGRPSKGSSDRVPGRRAPPGYPSRYTDSAM